MEKNKTKIIRVGIVGASGYSGKILLDVLLSHPNVRVTYVSAFNTQGPVAEIWPHLNGRTDLECKKFNAKDAIASANVFFLALPHTESMKIAPQLLKAGKKVIDLSADYRLKDYQEYEKWYAHKHVDPKYLAGAVYGLPELYREKIKTAKLLANPGCYPTAAILGLTPLLATHSENIQSIIIDAKSGVSGAGRKAVQSLMFAETNENFKAYKVLSHQHTPEINNCLSQVAGQAVGVSFVAHLLPINQGILETIYVRLNKAFTVEKVYDIYRKFYKTEEFVRILKPGLQPETKHVFDTNFCDIGFAVSDDGKLIVITSAIDNLVKGASGQAVQNFNIMHNFKETQGLL